MAKAAAAQAAGWRTVARIWAAARIASSRDVERAGGPPTCSSMSRKSAGRGKGEGQREARVARGDIPCDELEVQEGSKSKFLGRPKVLSTKLVLLEAPDSRGQWVQRSALKLPGISVTRAVDWACLRYNLIYILVSTCKEVL